MNAKEEFLKHVEGRTVVAVDLRFANETQSMRCVSKDMEEILEFLDREYDGGYGFQELFGTIWYEKEGTWSERDEYDGSEWWVYKECPELPAMTEEEKMIRSLKKAVCDAGVEGQVKVWSEDSLSRLVEKLAPHGIRFVFEGEKECEV